MFSACSSFSIAVDVRERVSERRAIEFSKKFRAPPSYAARPWPTCLAPPDLGRDFIAMKPAGGGGGGGGRRGVGGLLKALDLYKRAPSEFFTEASVLGSLVSIAAVAIMLLLCVARGDGAGAPGLGGSHIRGGETPLTSIDTLAGAPALAAAVGAGEATAQPAGQKKCRARRVDALPLPPPASNKQTQLHNAASVVHESGRHDNRRGAPPFLMRRGFFA